MENTIILTGGGTAGHVIPNIAIIPKLEKFFNKIVYIGSFNGIEKTLISKFPNVEYVPIPTAKLIRKLTLKNLALPFTLIKSISQCKKILKKLKPKVIFSKGGYVAVPVVIAAKSLKIPIIAHESDSTIGLANKIIYKLCDTMFFSFQEAMEKYTKKGVFSGSPIRDEFLHPKRDFKLQGLDTTKPIITVIGGSLGSFFLNKTIIECLPKLQNFNVINIVGKGKSNKEIKYKNYFQLEFVDNIASLCNISELVISRAGSNAIFEFLALKKPMILIPLPKEESRGDQIINAEIFAKNGYAKVIFQESLNKEILLEEIKNLIKNKNKYISAMNESKTTNATNIIAKKLIEYTHKK